MEYPTHYLLAPTLPPPLSVHPCWSPIRPYSKYWENGKPCVDQLDRDTQSTYRIHHDLYLKTTPVGSHKHGFLAQKPTSIYTQPRSWWHQHRLVTNEWNFSMRITRIQFLLDYLIESEHSNEIPWRSLSSIEVDECRLVLQWREFHWSYMALNLYLTILL